MAGRKMNLLRLLGVASVAVVLVGCPELAMKGAIKSLASPANPGSVRVVSGGDRVFKVSWVDPADKDVASIEISFSTPFATKAPPAPVSVPLGVQRAVVNVPLNNVWYFITVKAVDKAGNKSPGVTPVDFINFKLPYTVGLKKYEYNYIIPSPPGAVSYSYSYVYDGNGNLTQQNYFSGATQSAATQTSEDDFTYNANGQVIRDDSFPWSGGVKGAETSYNTSAYDSNGNLVIQSYFSGTTLSSQNTYEYDASGNLIQQSYYSPAGILYSYNTYTYDSEGHLATQTYNNVGSPSNNSSYTYQWDPTTHFIGKLTYTYGSSSFSEVITFSSGTLSVGLYTGTTYGGGSALIFDANGLETTQQSLNASGVVTYSDEYQYDINGRQIEYNSYNYPSNVKTQSYRTTDSY
jgi:hypothetical protein